MGRGRRPGAQGGRRRLSNGGAAAALLLAATGSEAVEARAEGLLDEVLLVQLDRRRQSLLPLPAFPEKNVADSGMNFTDPWDPDMLQLHQRPFGRRPLIVMRGALKNVSTGEDSNLGAFFRDTIAFSASSGREIGLRGATVSVGAEALVSSTEKVMWFTQRVFDTVSATDMRSVYEAANNMQKSLNSYREKLHDRADDFMLYMRDIKSEKELIRSTVDWMSNEVRDLRPVVKENTREFLRILRQVDWGKDWRHVHMTLLMSENTIVNSAALMLESIQTVVRDWDDLTPIGFCKIITAPISNFSSSTRSMVMQLQMRQQDLMSLQSVTAMPTAEEQNSAPAVLDVSARMVDWAASLVGVASDALQILESGVGNEVRRRLKCKQHSMISGAPSARLAAIVLAVAVLGVWRPATL